jgi:hypothetical protein
MRLIQQAGHRNTSPTRQRGKNLAASLARRVSVLILLVLAGLSPAQTSYPMLTHATPVVVQRGQTTTISVAGRMNLAGTYRAIFEGEGIEAEVVKPAAKGTVSTVQVKVTPRAEVLPGVREFRLISTRGVSSVGQLVISADPVVQEKGKNDTRETAQTITLPCALAGRLERAEDVDSFRFHAREGETCTFEVLCARIEDKIHDLQKHADPLLTLLDAEGRELAANDDACFADPLLSYTFEREGDYILQVRDSKYDGDPRWVYAVLASNGPYVTHLYPMAGNPGKMTTVEPVGSARKWTSQATVQAPVQPGLHHVILDVAGQKTNPVPFLVSNLPQILEQEPNDDASQATRIAVPCGINGRAEKDRDLDYFVFTGKKGQALHFEVQARRFGTPLLSSLDSVLEVMNDKGRILQSNDDTSGKDAALVFTPPADGDYFLRMRDLNSKGGLTAVYHIEAEPARPDFSLRCDGDKAMIGPGSRTAWFVHLERQNGFKGPVKVEVSGLPAGVTVQPLTIPESMSEGLLVLSAAPDAPLGASNVEIVGSGTVTVEGKEKTLTRKVQPQQEIYMPGGGRSVFDVNLQTVAVTEPSDILDIQVTPARVDLKPGQEIKLDVTIQRNKSYTKAVSLDVMLRHLNRVYGNPLPPGVTLVEGKSKTRLGTGNTGHLVLRADAKAAPVKDVPICVLAHVSINFVVKVGYASAPILVSVK